MAVGAFTFYNMGKQYISGTINLGSTNFSAHLYTSASNFATATLSTLAGLTNEVASGNGYKLSGKALTTVTWGAGTSAAQKKFTSSAFLWTATGGTIASIKGLVLVAQTGASAKASTNKLLCFCTLTTAQFTLASANTLTITPSATGIFTLV